VAAAALCVLKTLDEENIIRHCAEVGQYFKERLLELKSRHDSVVDVRGLGLLLGMELNIDGLPLVQACLEKGFVINCVQGNTLRFVPPLIVQKAEIDRLIHCLDEIL
jgi:4-aminobutyrate aminotransferase-like enzyme